MNTGDMMKKIEELLENEEFAAKMSACESCEELAELFVAEGIPMTTDDAEQMVAEVNRQGSGEMDENDLDSVAGGSLVDVLKTGVVVARFIIKNRPSIILPVVPRINPRLIKRQ